MKLGITGGIGSGKSFVCRLLHEDFDVPVYDCDREAKRLMVTSALVRKGLTALVGDEAYLPEGQLARPVVARYLFASKDNAARINALVHPAVREDFLRWAEEQEKSHPIVAVESAILIEAGFRSAVDKVLLVDAPVELRLERAMQRDGATAEQVRERMHQQLDAEARRAAADYIILNDGSPLMPQLSNFIDTLLVHSRQ